MALNFGSRDLKWRARIDTGMLQQDASKTQSIFGKLGKQIAAAGIFAGLAVGAKRAIGEIINVNKEFEKSISTLSSITGAVGEDLDFYKQKAIEFGSETTQSAVEVSEAFKLIGSQRPELLQNKEALADLTREAIMLAEASSMDVPRAAKAITGSLNQMGKSAKDASLFIDILANGAQLGSGDIDFLSTAVEKSGKVAADSNLEFNELIAALEFLAPAITEPSQAGNQLSSMLLSLQKNGKGFESGAFDLKDALIEVQEELKGIIDPGKRAEREIQLFGQANITAGKTLTENIDNFDDFAESLLKTGTAAEQARTNTDNLEGNLKKFHNAMNALMLTIGIEGGLTGALSNIVKLATDIVKRFTEGNSLTKAFKDFRDSVNRVIQPMTRIIELLSDTEKEGDAVGGVIDMLAGVFKMATMPIRLASDAIGKLLGWLLEFKGVEVFIQKVGDAFRVLSAMIKEAAMFLGLIERQEEVVENLFTWGVKLTEEQKEQLALQEQQNELLEKELEIKRTIFSEQERERLRLENLYLLELQRRTEAREAEAAKEEELGLESIENMQKQTNVMRTEYDIRTDIAADFAKKEEEIEAEKERKKIERAEKTAAVLNEVFEVTALAIENSGDSIEGTLRSVLNSLRTFAIQSISIYLAKSVSAVVADAFDSFGIKGLVIAPVVGAATAAMFDAIVPKFKDGGVHDLSGGSVIPGIGTRDNQLGLFMPNEVTLNPKQQANLLFNMAQKRDSGSPEMIKLLSEQNQMLRNSKTLIEKNGELWQVDFNGKLTGNRII